MIAPAKNPGMKELQQQRDGEIGLLKAQLDSLADTLKNDPVDWVRKHPYLATGSAAAAGFLAAQLLGGKSAAPAPPPPRPAPLRAPAPAASAPTPKASDRLLNMVAEMAEKYLAQAAGSVTGPDEVVGTVAIADTGSACGPQFPGDFSMPPQP